MSLNISDTLVSGGSFPIASGSLSGSLTQVVPGLSFIAAGANITVTSGSNGQIVIAGAASTPPTAGEGISVSGTAVSLNLSGGSGILLSSGSGNQVNVFNTKTGDDRASYIVSATTASLPNASLLAAGEGLSVSGATLSLNIAAGTNVTLASGSGNQVTINATTQNPTAGEGISVAGSAVSLNLSAGTGVTLTSGSGNQVVVGVLATSVTGTWRDPGNTFVTTGSVSIDTKNRTAASLGSDVFFFVSGSIGIFSATDPNKHVALFGGRIHSSGAVRAEQGFTGSLTTIDGSVSFLAGSPNINIVTASNGQVVASLGGTASGSLGGNYPNPIVTSIDGAPAVSNQYNVGQSITGSVVYDYATQVRSAASSSFYTDAINAGPLFNSYLTYQTIGTVPILSNSFFVYTANVSGADFGFNGGTIVQGDCIDLSLKFIGTCDNNGLLNLTSQAGTTFVTGTQGATLGLTAQGITAFKGGAAFNTTAMTFRALVTGTNVLVQGASNINVVSGGFYRMNAIEQVQWRQLG